MIPADAAPAKPLPAAFHAGRDCPPSGECPLCRQNATSWNVREHRRKALGLTEEEAERVTPWRGPPRPRPGAARPADPPPAGRTLAPQAGGGGPVGSELKALLGLLGFDPRTMDAKARCGKCLSLAEQMDAWGPEGCRANEAAILAHLRAQHKLLSPLERARAYARGAALVARGLLPLIDPRDPGPGLLREAIRRAEAAAGPGCRPLSITRVEGLVTGEAGAAFNASLFRRNGRLLLAYRTGWEGARIHVARVSEGLQVLGNTTLDLRHPRCSLGCEDPRFFEHAGELWLSFIGVRGGGGRPLDTHQMLARLTDDLTVAEVVYPEYPQRRQWEKNHLYLSRRDDRPGRPTLYSVYTLHPWVVLEIDGSRAGEAYRVEWEPSGGKDWPGGSLRGGASPVRVGDELWLWFHGKQELAPRYLYSVGVLACDARPPFRPLRITPRPLYRPDCSTCPPGRVCCTFPAGAIMENGRWLVSAGLHDHLVEVLTFDHAEVDRFMAPV